MNILIEVMAEMERAKELKLQGEFPNTVSDPISYGQKLAILTEEVGEVARAINDDHAQQMAELRKELIQVAAVASSWAESLS